MKKNFLVFLTLIILSYTCFYPALKAPFIYDSKTSIENNTQIRTMHNLGENLFAVKTVDPKLIKYFNDPARPVTFLTFHLNYYFNQDNPTGYRIANISLLSLLGFLIYLLLFKLLNISYSDKESHVTAFIASILFVLHPLNVHTTTYVYHRSELLVLLFYILSLLFYYKSCVSKNTIYLIISIMSFALGLFSKQIVVVLPFALMFFDYLFCSDCTGKKLLENKYKWMPFWIIFLAYNIYRFTFLKTDFLIHQSPTVANRISYFLQQPKNIILYFIKALIPNNLLLLHDHKQIESLSDAKFVIPFFIMVSLTIIAAGLLKKAVKTKAYRYYFFGAFFFLINIIPTSSFLISLETMADRRLYASIFGVILMTAVAALSIARKKVFLKKVILLIFIIQAVTFFALTFKFNYKMNNPATIWEEIIEHYPLHETPYVHLATTYAQQKKTDKAEQLFFEALKINPDNSSLLGNMAVFYHKQKQYNKALDYALDASERNPKEPKWKMLTADIYRDLNQTSKSLKIYQELLNDYPNLIDIKLKVIRLLFDLKKYNAALGLINIILESFPDNNEYICIKSSILLNLNNSEEAHQGYLKVLDTDPDNQDALHGLGMYYFQQKKYDKTKEMYFRLIKIDDQYPLPYNNLGAVFLEEQNIDKGQNYFKKAIAADKDYLPAYINLAKSYLDTGHKEKAVTVMKQYLKHNPTNKKALGYLNILNKKK